MLKKLRSQIGEGEATQRSAMAEITNIFRLEGSREVTVLLDLRDGITQQEITGGPFGWSWNQRGDSATVTDVHRQRKVGRITLVFFHFSILQCPSRATHGWELDRNRLTEPGSLRNTASQDLQRNSRNGFESRQAIYGQAQL